MSTTCSQDPNHLLNRRETYLLSPQCKCKCCFRKIITLGSHFYCINLIFLFILLFSSIESVCLINILFIWQFSSPLEDRNSKHPLTTKALATKPSLYIDAGDFFVSIPLEEASSKERESKYCVSRICN